MSTKCIKLEIKFNKENKIKKDRFFKELRNKQYDTYVACNKAMTMYYVNAMQDRIIKDIGIPKQSDEDLYGKGFRAYVANQIKESMNNPSSYIVDEVSTFVNSKFNADKKNGLLKGERALASFKRDIPVMTRNKSYKVLEKSEKNYQLNLVLFTNEEMLNFEVENHKKGEGILFDFVNPDASRRSILNRISTGEYKQGSIKLQYNERKSKWMAIISYTFESNIPDSTDKVNIMGVDLGITRIATMAVYNPIEEEHKFISYNHDVLNGEELIHFRQKVEARRRDLGRASKISNTTGHGYKRRMQKFAELGDKVARFRDTKNHSISRYIVNQAIKYNCAIIQFENLSGYTDAAKSSFLKSWSYFDLQSKVEYKAKEAGIEVVFIAPEYTSQRCNKCGCIDSANRDCKNAQAKFECISCGHKDNADNNAAKNISLPNITELIKASINDKKKSEKKLKKLAPVIPYECMQLSLDSLSLTKSEIVLDEGDITFN